MENKKLFPSFIGPSYTARPHPYDSQETINFYLESDPTGDGKNQQPAVLIGTPGLRFLQTFGLGPIRATYTVSNQLVSNQFAYIVSGNTVYQITSGTSTPVAITGTLTTTSGPVSVSDNGNQVLIVDGLNGYYITIGDTTLNLITDPNFYPADFVSFQDGYFILNRTGTNIFFLSDLYAVTFPALNEEAKTGNSDLLVAAVSVSRQLYLLGTNTTEIWYDAGTSGSSPFARQDGRFSQFGCASAATIAIIGEQFCWLGSNAQGTGQVFTLEASMPQVISTRAVEYSIQNAIGDIRKSTAFAYQQEGHFFYVLNVPGTGCTWVYDMTTEQWHKRKDWPQGIESRWYGETHCLLNDVHLVGDYRNGNLYQLDLDCYTDNGETMYHVRTTPPMTSSNNNVVFHLIDMDFQFGVGIPDTAIPIGSVYTQYGGFSVQTTSGNTGIVNFLNSSVPFSMDVSVPQASNYPTNGQSANTLLKTSGLVLGNPSIGMGNLVSNYPNQIPIYPGSRTYTGSSSTNYSPSYYFPMRVDDLIWIHSLIVNQDNGQFSIEVRVGVDINDADVYEIVATPVDGFPWVTTVTYTGSIGERNPQ